MPRSPLASYPERPPPHAHPATRSHQGHLAVAPLTVRKQQLNQATSQGVGNSLVLGLVGAWSPDHAPTGLTPPKLALSDPGDWFSGPSVELANWEGRRPAGTTL